MAICTSVCSYDINTMTCVGCGRTSEEITEWFYATDDRKREIAKMAKERKKSTMTEYMIYKTEGVDILVTMKPFTSFEECQKWCEKSSTKNVRYSPWKPETL